MMQRQSVLVADDNECVRDALRLLQALDDYSILEASDCVEAVEALRRSPDPLVVLLDLRMPHLSGLELLDLLDASRGAPEELTRHAYILMVADTRLMDTAHASILAHHHIPHLEKPFDLEDLLAVLARAESCLTRRA